MSPAFTGWIYLSYKCDSKQSRNVYRFRSFLAAVSCLWNNTFNDVIIQKLNVLLESGSQG